MAELLIMAVDNTHPDPVKNERAMYKRGDVVAVREDNHAWGAKEGLPKFIVITVPGPVTAELRALTEPDIEPESEADISLGTTGSEPEFGAELPTSRRRHTKFDVDGLPLTNGKGQVNQGQFIARAKRKNTSTGQG